MTRSKEDRELLVSLGYDPDDPAYSIEHLDNEITVTETPDKTDTVEEGITSLKIAIQAAIEALQRVQDLLK